MKYGILIAFFLTVFHQIKAQSIDTTFVETNVKESIFMEDSIPTREEFDYSDVLSINDSIVENDFNDRSFTQRLKSGQLPYFLDDVMFIIGINRSGLYYSQHYRDLDYKSGFSLGLEGYSPVFDKATFHYGILFSQLGFYQKSSDITFDTYHLEFPVFLAYELPAFRQFEWRLIVGSQVNTRIGSSQNGSYLIFNPEETFIYNTRGFRRMDWGFTFGLSAEYNNFYVRLRSFSGVVKLVRQDQAMMNSWSMEIGYFIFRRFR
ncbi:MAG: outer membrane beta-barrel protein [Cyclobacteriaceae bacterium]|nr:outer membrane beta-barrel protein [Cyclobacteriaceae bacterium]